MLLALAPIVSRAFRGMRIVSVVNPANLSTFALLSEGGCNCSLAVRVNEAITSSTLTWGEPSRRRKRGMRRLKAFSCRRGGTNFSRSEEPERMLIHAQLFIPVVILIYQVPRAMRRIHTQDTCAAPICRNFWFITRDSAVCSLADANHDINISVTFPVCVCDRVLCSNVIST